MQRWAILTLLVLVLVALVPIARDALERTAERSARDAAVAEHVARDGHAVRDGDYHRAEQALTAAATLAPHDPTVAAARLRAGVSRAAEQPETILDAELAALTYAASLADPSQHADAAPAAAHVAARRGDAEAAVAGYRSAIALDATYVPAHLGLAQLRRRGDQTDALAAFHDSAAQLLAKVIEVEPAATEAYWLLGQSLLALGNQQGAGQAWSRFLQLAGDDPEWAQQVGELRAKLAPPPNTEPPAPPG